MNPVTIMTMQVAYLNAIQLMWLLTITPHIPRGLILKTGLLPCFFIAIKLYLRYINTNAVQDYYS